MCSWNEYIGIRVARSKMNLSIMGIQCKACICFSLRSTQIRSTQQFCHLLNTQALLSGTPAHQLPSEQPVTGPAQTICNCHAPRDQNLPPVRSLDGLEIGCTCSLAWPVRKGGGARPEKQAWNWKVWVSQSQTVGTSLQHSSFKFQYSFCSDL